MNSATKSFGGRGQDPLRRVVLGDARSLLQDRDPVAHLDRLVESWVTKTMVLRTSDCSRRNSSCSRSRTIGVDRSERLVHQHHVRVAAERAGDPDPLQLTAGQLLRVAVPVLARGHVDDLEQLVDARVDAGPVPAEQLRHRRDVLRDRPVREQPDPLDDVADPASQLVGVAPS
jgi:hypothetical protein